MTSNDFSVERILVKKNRMVCTIRVAEQVQPKSNKALACFLLQKRPQLQAHSCVNEKGSKLMDVVNNTSLPHLFEHIVIDIQVAEADVHDMGFYTGTTEWLDDEQGIACVQIQFRDDLKAFSAIKQATALMNEAIQVTQHYRCLKSQNIASYKENIITAQ